MALYKSGNVKCFFDSFGRVPPITLQKYLGNGIDYSTNVIQKPGQAICGHLCLNVLNRLHSCLHALEKDSRPRKSRQRIFLDYTFKKTCQLIS